VVYFPPIKNIICYKMKRSRNQVKNSNDSDDETYKKKKYDEEITSEEEEEEENVFVNFDEHTNNSEENEEEKEEEDKETIDEKRIRKAKEYLNKISKIVDLEKNDEEDDETQDPIVLKLRQESKRMSRFVPENYSETVILKIFKNES
jgi:hypothetical protein